MISLTHGSTTITLPSPVFNDTHSLHSTRINRFSRGGKQIVFRDSTWPQIETFDWSFEALSKAQRDEFIDFLNDTLGLEVTVLDWEERTWTGIIVDPQEEMREVLTTCGYTIHISFEGVQV